MWAPILLNFPACPFHRMIQNGNVSFLLKITDSCKNEHSEEDRCKSPSSQWDVRQILALFAFMLINDGTLGLRLRVYFSGWFSLTSEGCQALSRWHPPTPEGLVCTQHVGVSVSTWGSSCSLLTNIKVNVWKNFLKLLWDENKPTQPWPSSRKQSNKLKKRTKPGHSEVILEAC